MQAVASGAVRIMPERFVKIYNFWLGNIRDWCISRQLWWGHRIPVWYVVAEAEGKGAREYIVARNEGEAYACARERCAPVGIFHMCSAGSLTRVI